MFQPGAVHVSAVQFEHTEKCWAKFQQELQEVVLNLAQSININAGLTRDVWHQDEEDEVVGVEGEVDGVGQCDGHVSVLLNGWQHAEVAEQLASHTQRVQH